MLYKAASKVYLAGEYAVLKPNAIAVIAPVKKYTYLKLEESQNQIIITNIKDKKNLIKNSMQVAFEFSKKRKNFKYTYTTELYENDKKLGLGSSASVVVVTIKAILGELDIKYNKDDLFKLSVLAMNKSNLKGSMGDVACIVYEDLIEYHSLDKDNFTYKILPIKPKNKLKIKLIHTGILADTDDQIKKVDIRSNDFQSFYNSSNEYVKNYIKAIKNSDKKMLEESIVNLRNNLEFLEKTSEVLIHSDKIKSAIIKNNNIKTSGAGMGDYLVEVRIEDGLSSYEIEGL